MSAAVDHLMEDELLLGQVLQNHVVADHGAAQIERIQVRPDVLLAGLLAAASVAILASAIAVWKEA